MPLLGLPCPEGMAVIASNFGQRPHPGWYHNLRARPEAEIAVRGVRRRVRAVEAGPELRARLWAQGLRTYPGWAAYERRADNRRIAVFVLEPLGLRRAVRATRRARRGAGSRRAGRRPPAT